MLLATILESRRWLATWSKRYGWQDAVAAHDEYVGTALLLRLRERAVDQQFDRVVALQILSQRWLDAVNNPATNMKVSTASVGMDAIRLVEVLTAGAKERREEQSQGIAAEAMAILAQIGADKRASIPIRKPLEIDRLPPRR